MRARRWNVLATAFLMLAACKCTEPNAPPPPPVRPDASAPQPSPPARATCSCDGLRVVDFPLVLEEVPFEPPPGWGVCRFCRRDCSVALASADPAGLLPWPPVKRMTTSSGDATELTFVVDARGLVREKRGSKWRRTYEFDDAGTLERETFHEQRDGYSWDEAFWYRETRFDGGSKTETFRRVGDGGWSLSATRTTWVEREGRRFRTLVDDDEESLEDFDDQGRPVLRSSPHGRATFSYDDAGQLARLRLGSEVHQFFYDDAGTRMREVSGLGLTVWTIAADGLPTRQRSTTGFDSMEYRYDTHRHLVERVRDTGVTFSYEYDEERVGVWLETAPWCVRRQPSR